MNRSQLSRRRFLTRTMAVAGTLSAGWSLSVLGANERIGIALIGCGGRGRLNARGMALLGAQIVWLCDVYQTRARQTQTFLERYAPKERVRGIRLTGSLDQVLDDPAVDAVIVATPDHWHALATIRAVMAGKDVYVEKPHAHTIQETELMIRAAERYRRIVQVGTQNRSGAYNLEALQYIREGHLGPIHLVKVYNLKSGSAFHLGDPGKKPDDLNWDMWLGPAPYRPWHRRIYYSGWQRFWDYCGGDLRNDGIHQVDLALMLMGDPGFPKSVSATGGRIAHRGDDGQDPDVLVAHFDFGNFVLTVEHTNYPKFMHKTNMTIREGDEFPFWLHNSTRIEIYGTEQMLVVGRHGGGWQATVFPWKVVAQQYGRPCDMEHYRNFLDCIKTRKEPNASLRIAQPAWCVLEMANIAHRTGNRTLHFDATQKRFLEPEANAYLSRSYRHPYELPKV